MDALDQDHPSGREEVRDTINNLHSYDLPECLCLAIEDGSQEYLDWLRESVEEFGGKNLE